LVRDNGIGSLEREAGADGGSPVVDTPASPDLGPELADASRGDETLAAPSLVSRSSLELPDNTKGSHPGQVDHVGGATKLSRAPIFVALYFLAFVGTGIAVALITLSLLSDARLDQGSEQAHIGVSTALGLAVTGIALIAAVLMFPAFVGWAWRQLAEPKMALTLSAYRDLNSLSASAGDGQEGAITIVTAEDHTFIVRVAAFNRGTAVLEHGILSLQVPAQDYRIEALDHPLKQHFSGAVPRSLGDGDQGGPGVVRYTSACNYFAPGTPYILHGKITALGAGTCRVAVFLRGYAPNGRRHAWYDYIDLEVSFPR
jgi:hypothetical protein